MGLLKWASKNNNRKFLFGVKLLLLLFWLFIKVLIVGVAYHTRGGWLAFNTRTDHSTDSIFPQFPHFSNNRDSPFSPVSSPKYSCRTSADDFGPKSTAFLIVRSHRISPLSAPFWRTRTPRSPTSSSPSTSRTSPSPTATPGNSPSLRGRGLCAFILPKKLKLSGKLKIH